MPFKGMKKALFVTGLAFGLAASSSVFAGVQLKCHSVKVKELGVQEKKEVVLEGKKKRKDVVTLSATQVCVITGADASQFKKLPAAYKSVLKSYKKPLDADKPKERLETFNKIESEGSSKFQVEHTRPTKNGTMTFNASLTLEETSGSFSTSYYTPGLSKKVERYHLNNNAKYTQAVTEKTTLTPCSGGVQVAFERTVDIVRPVAHGMFIGPAMEGMEEDLSSLVAFHKAVYDLAF